MKPQRAISMLSLLFVASVAAAKQTESTPLTFDITTGVERSMSVHGVEAKYLAYEGLPYVAKPTEPDYQQLNIYIPKAYITNQAQGRFQANTAPIFLPNHVGGYMPALPKQPGVGRDQQPDAMSVALAKGLVVVSPGTRGRTLTGADGRFSGKAPAAIVDLKAVVRYLKFNDQRMPGNAERIISNGTSAGGALSALLGASGDAPEFLPYLEKLGAAPGSDAIFAVSSYCPITNLDHADLAYEWMFQSVHEATRPKRAGGPAFAPAASQGAVPAQSEPNQPRRPAGAPMFNTGPMSPEQLKVSALLAEQFPAYLNSLRLTWQGQPMTLDTLGAGTFKRYLLNQLQASATRAKQEGAAMGSVSWLKETDSGFIADWDRYIESTGRLKKAPAFDSLDLSSGENSLFGDSTTDTRHFTTWGLTYHTGPSTAGELAPVQVVTMMNPMNFIGVSQVNTSVHWRIRHGTADNDTALAVPAMLALKLENSGKQVDFALPFGQSHGGDYDLPELFDWIEKLP